MQIMIKLWAVRVYQDRSYAQNGRNIHFFELYTAINNFWNRLKQAQSKWDQLWSILGIIFGEQFL